MNAVDFELVTHILFILLGAIILHWMVVFLNKKLLVFVGKMHHRLEDEDQRIKTISTVVMSTSSFLISLISLLMILKELNIDTTPLLASAGVVGLAISFGAQALIKDVFAGLFILIEDQYREGDLVKLDEFEGKVLHITLRKTLLKSEHGVHHIPNGSIKVASVIREKK